MCLCNKMKCSQLHSDVGSLCAIRCIDPRTGVRFPCTSRLCTCIVCQCVCNKVYAIGDVQKIKIRQIQLAAFASPSTSSQGDGMAEATTFMAGAIATGMNGVRGLINGELARQKSGHGMLDDQIEKQAEDNLWAMASSHAIQRSSQLSASAHESMRHTFGRDTRVVLPSGDSFDTRSIANANFHAQNNNLHDINSLANSSATSSSANRSHLPPMPGMSSIREISYSNLSPAFTAVATGQRRQPTQPNDDNIIHIDDSPSPQKQSSSSSSFSHHRASSNTPTRD